MKIYYSFNESKKKSHITEFRNGESLFINWKPLLMKQVAEFCVLLFW